MIIVCLLVVMCLLVSCVCCVALVVFCVCLYGSIWFWWFACGGICIIGLMFDCWWLLLIVDIVLGMFACLCWCGWIIISLSFMW